MFENIIVWKTYIPFLQTSTSGLDFVNIMVWTSYSSCLDYVGSNAYIPFCKLLFQVLIVVNIMNYINSRINSSLLISFILAYINTKVNFNTIDFVI